MSIIEKASKKFESAMSMKPERVAPAEDVPEISTSSYETSGEMMHDHPGPGLERESVPERSRQSRMITLDMPKLKKSGYLTPGTINIVLAEQYRRIKMPILANAFEEKGAHLANRNLVMVTSAVPKEGKSFTSLNLALSIATEFNQTALFIDADIARHTNSSFLGLAAEPGLSDLLMSDNNDVGDYLLKTDIPNLTLLPAGKYHEKGHEMWASNKMRNLLVELSTRYPDRVVIFDAPPVLLDSSAQILARQVGQVLFVIEAEKTHKQMVMEALESIAESQYIGLVLNKSNRRLVSEYGYYGHVNFPLPVKKQAGESTG
jgi:protein-tyrosine kinase